MKRFFFILPAFISLAFLVSCETDPIETQEKTIVEITDDISSATTWSGDNIYIIKKYDFYVESNLTIMPGAIVKFTDESANLTIGNGGSISANGDSDNPIIFTAYSDDSHGGDSNGNGQSSAVAGTWGMIDVSGYQADFTYCEFYYGGSGEDGITLQYPSNSSGSVENCIFKYNMGSATETYSYGVLSVEGANSSLTITNTSFENNILPLSINADINIDNSNDFSNNTYSGIFVSGSVNDTTTWLETEVAFVYTGTNFQVNNGGKLNMGSGVTIKFVKDSEMVLYNGISNLSDNYNNPDEINYTSYKDDSMGGDSNGDGGITMGGSTDWKGIYVSVDNKEYAQWSNIHYASSVIV